MLVHTWDTETGQEDYFWDFTLYPFTDWDQWDDLIESHIEMYGMELA